MKRERKTVRKTKIQNDYADLRSKLKRLMANESTTDKEKQAEIAEVMAERVSKESIVLIKTVCHGYLVMERNPDGSYKSRWAGPVHAIHTPGDVMDMIEDTKGRNR